MTAANGLAAEVAYTQAAAKDVAAQNGRVPTLSGSTASGSSNPRSPSSTSGSGGSPQSGSSSSSSSSSGSFAGGSGSTGANGGGGSGASANGSSAAGGRSRQAVGLSKGEARPGVGHAQNNRIRVGLGGLALPFGAARRPDRRGELHRDLVAPAAGIPSVTAVDAPHGDPVVVDVLTSSTTKEKRPEKSSRRSRRRARRPHPALARTLSSLVSSSSFPRSGFSATRSC